MKMLNNRTFDAKQRYNFHDELSSMVLWLNAFAEFQKEFIN